MDEIKWWLFVSEILERKMNKIMKEFRKYKEEVEDRDKRRDNEEKIKKERMEMKKKF